MMTKTKKVTVKIKHLLPNNKNKKKQDFHLFALFDRVCLTWWSFVVLFICVLLAPAVKIIIVFCCYYYYLLFSHSVIQSKSHLSLLSAEMQFVLIYLIESSVSLRTQLWTTKLIFCGKWMNEYLVEWTDRRNDVIFLLCIFPFFTVH